MPSVNYMNQSAPFWDFVASLEQDGRNHPFFSQNPNENTEQGHPHHPPPPPPPPFGGAWGGWGMPFWGAALPHHGPPPPPEAQRGEKEDADMSDVKEKQPHGEDKPHGEDQDNGEGPSNSHSDSDDHARGHGRRGRCGPGRHGRRGHGHGPGPYGFGGGFGPHHGPGHHGRRGGWGGWGGRGRGFNPFDFAAGLFDPSSSSTNNNNDSGDFSPETDVFDTPTAFVVHVALPGAKKEDVGVNWDAEKSELSIAGVIYRPGDEDFLKTLAMDERKIGPFERKIRLGTRANPAQIDAEGITAKLEDGLLKVEVPKLEKEGFVEVRKVDIE